MKVGKTFTVRIDDAEFDFHQVSQLEVVEHQAAARENPNAGLSFVLARLAAVRNVEDDDGPIGPEKFRDMSLPWSLVTKLVRKFWDTVVENAGLKGAEAKNAQ